MHASAHAAGRKNQLQRQQTVSAFGRAAPDLLAIPKLDNSIEATVEFDKCGSRWAKMALLWLDAEELTEADSGHPRELVQTAVSRWMEKQVAGMKYLNAFEVSVQSYPDPCGDRYEHGNVDPDKQWFFGLVTEGSLLQWFQLDKRITALEQAHPGLGQTALEIFDDKASRFPPILTPNVARFLASQVWWYWQEDQESYEAEMSSYWDEEELDPEMLAQGPDWFDAEFPEWMFINPHERKTLTADQLQEIAASSESDEARRVAALLLQLMARERESYRLPVLQCDGIVEGDNAYYMAYVCWNPNDPLQRLNDDHIQRANECGDGYTDVLGADAVPLDQDGFSKWKSELEAGFAVLRKLDALLPLIADPFEEE